MYCRNCGKEVAEEAVACLSCGMAPSRGRGFCQSCGQATNPEAEVCVHCGVRLATRPAGGEAKSKLVAGLLGIFLGGLGIHRFYLGYNKIGAIQAILTAAGIVTCGILFPLPIGAAIWGLVEGIMILTGKIDKDANGNPLAE